MNKNYITIKQLNQHPKFKEDFIKWWKPKACDVIEYKNRFYCIQYVQGDLISLPPFINIFKNECNPSIQIHHLIQYIENKTNGKVEMYYSWDYYTIAIRNTGCGGDDPQIDTGETNLLQALFQVAYKISEEG